MQDSPASGLVLNCTLISRFLDEELLYKFVIFNQSSRIRLIRDIEKLYVHYAENDQSN